MKRRDWLFERLESRDLLAVLSGEPSPMGPEESDENNSSAELALELQWDAVAWAAADPNAAKIAPRLSAFLEVVRAAFTIPVEARGAAFVADVIQQLNLEHIGVAQLDDGGRIRVHISIAGDMAGVLSSIASAGGTVESMRSTAGMIQAWLPWDRMALMAAVPSVKSLNLPSSGTTNTGSVNTAGDSILRADQVRARFAAYGVSGSGLKIGVISGGVAHRSNVQSEANPNLPATITVHPVLSGLSTNDEGTAMLEIVHDLAPGAALYFAGFRPNGIFSALDMADAVDWLVQQNVDVIVDDISFREEPFFYEGPLAVVASAVQESLDSGVVYVASAGNAALRHYQGQWNGAANGYHDFNTGTVEDTNLAIQVPGNATVDVVLQRSDPWGASGNNYNLFLIHPTTGNILNNFDPGETNTGFVPQDGNDNPIESVNWTNPQSFAQSINVRVTRIGTTASRELEILLGSNSEITDNEAVPGDSIHGQHALAGVLSVGAIDAADPGNNTIWEKTSQGPSTVYTNFATQAKQLRPSLDGAAIHGVQTRVGQLGFFANPFNGTSAAAPHVAAIAALVLDANPTLSVSQVEAILTSTAVDIEAVGYDNIAGNGRFDALAAVYKAFTPAAADMTGQLNATQNRQPTFTGQVPLGSYVRLYADSNVVDETQLGATIGTYSLVPDSPLAIGAHNMTIRVAENATTPLVNLSNPSPLLSIEIFNPDINSDGTVDREDAATLAGNYGKTSGATLAQGDANGDGLVSLRDMALLQGSWTGGQALMGGGGGAALEGGGGSETVIGSEAGPLSFTGEPARFYVTTSDSLNGGGTYDGTTPTFGLSGPGDTTTLYVWAKTGDYNVIGTYGINLVASTPGVVKAIDTTVFNPDIIDVESGEPFGSRWMPQMMRAGALNADGIGGSQLVVDFAGGAFYTSEGGLHRTWTGGANSTLDSLYDPVGGGFLLQEITLEALPGSAGESTGLYLSVGRVKVWIVGMGWPQPLQLGAGTTTVANNAVGATDGTTHATITVAAGSPAPAPAATIAVAAPAAARTRGETSYDSVPALSAVGRRLLHRVDAAFSTPPSPLQRLNATRRIPTAAMADLHGRITDSLLGRVRA